MNKRDNSDIVRGNFGSFVGMLNYKGHACDQIEIKIPGYSENKLAEYVQLRAQDTSSFFAISVSSLIVVIKDAFPTEITEMLITIIQGKGFDTNIFIFMISIKSYQNLKEVRD